MESRKIEELKKLIAINPDTRCRDLVLELINAYETREYKNFKSRVSFSAQYLQDPIPEES